MHKPDIVRKWYRRTEKNKAKAESGEIVSPPKMPKQEDVFQNPRYVQFANLYFKIATSLGAFQELAQVYFEVMREDMFKEEKGKDDEFDDEEELESIIDDESVIEEESILTRIKNVFRGLFCFKCCSKS